jgi:hypothetical protein
MYRAERTGHRSSLPVAVVDIVEIDRRALEGLDTLVAGVTAPQREAVTPCTD